MTKRMREALAGLCVAAIGAVIGLVASGSQEPGEFGVGSLGWLVFAVAGVISLVVLAVEIVRD